MNLLIGEKNNIKFWPSWESNPGRHALQSNMHQSNEAVKFHDNVKRYVTLTKSVKR